MLKFDSQGLIPAIVQDANTRDVLMVAYMNAESVRRTVQTGDAWFWSRSRQELWHKGATSGNFQRVVRATADCDADAILIEVNPEGPACHTGATSCFFQPVEEVTADASVPSPSTGETQEDAAASASSPSTANASVPSPSTGEGEGGGGAAPSANESSQGHPHGPAVVAELARVIAERHATMPEGSYVAGLLREGIDRVAKKVGEEAVETIIAAKNGSHDEIVWEVADLWFHSLVLLEATGVPVDDVWQELARRRR